MKKLEVTLYNFSELEESIKERLISKQREINAEWMNFEFIREDWVDICEEAGFLEPKFDYSFGVGQSDNYFVIQSTYFSEYLIDKVFDEILGEGNTFRKDVLINNMRQNHDKNKSKYFRHNRIEFTASSYHIYYHNIESVLEKISDRITEILHEVCERCVKIAEDEIEYSYSEEYAIERLEDEGEVYLQDGHKYY